MSVLYRVFGALLLLSTIIIVVSCDSGPLGRTVTVKLSLPASEATIPAVTLRTPLQTLVKVGDAAGHISRTNRYVTVIWKFEDVIDANSYEVSFSPPVVSSATFSRSKMQEYNWVIHAFKSG
jgi:hypothetical protein